MREQGTPGNERSGNSDEGPSGPHRLALLVASHGNRRQLSRQLQRRYQLVEPDTDSLPDDGLDLAIVDGPGLERWQGWLEAVKRDWHPVFLPTMLILPRPDLRRGAAAQFPIVDDFITTPIDIDEFVERIDILLRARDRSLRQDEELAYRANHDPATGLPTQAFFMDRLSSAIEDAAARGETVHVIAIHVPLAHLMRSLGPGTIAEIARKSSDLLGKMLPQDIYRARLETEQGAFLLPVGTTVEDVTRVALQIAEVVHQPVDIDGEQIRLAAYLGVGGYPGDAGDAKGVLKAALSALDGAKNPGKPQFYSGEVQSRSLQYLRIENGLHRALAKNELELWYQPQFRLGDLELVGAEALIRWRLPSGELVSPADFIPIAEKSHLIQKIGAWVIETACTTLGEWCAHETVSPRVSVNLTPEDLMAPGFLAWLRGLLTDNDLDPGALEIELTETVLLDVGDAVLNRLNEIREFGVKVAIDDFGTGYSSLGYLHKLPADVLKIDKTFTDRVPGDESGEAITRAIVGLAKQFGLELVAEGIETREQLAYLDSLGVEYGQGFLVGRPLPAAQFLEYAAQGLRLKGE